MKPILYLMFLIFLSPNLCAEALYIPKYGASCSALEKGLEDYATFTARNYEERNYTAYDKENFEENPKVFTFLCSKDFLFRVDGAYVYENSHKAIQIYSDFLNMLIKEYGEPIPVEKVNYKNLSQLKKIDKGEMDKNDFFDYSQYEHKWQNIYDIIELSLFDADFGWYVSFTIKENRDTRNRSN